MDSTDKRKVTSKANMAKARQAKLDKLKKEKEIRDNLKTIAPPKFQEEESGSEYSSDEEVIYFNPPQSNPQPNQNELSEIKQMLQNLTEKKKKKEVVYVQQPQPIPDQKKDMINNMGLQLLKF